MNKKAEEIASLIRKLVLLCCCAIATHATCFAGEPKKKDLTFKGVHFGSNFSEFIEKFPSSSCDLSIEVMPVCFGGPIKYLGFDRAFYIAYFSSLSSGGRFRRVSVAVVSDKPMLDLGAAEKKISESFGKGENSSTSVGAENHHHGKKWILGGSGSIETSRCDGRDEIGIIPDYSNPNTMFRSFVRPGCPGKFVYIEIDSRLSPFINASPESDF